MLDTGYLILDICFHHVSNFKFLSRIRHPASRIQYPASSIKHQASSIKHQASSIKHPASSIEYRASSIQYRVPSIENLPRHPSSIYSQYRTIYIIGSRRRQKKGSSGNVFGLTPPSGGNPVENVFSAYRILLKCCG